MPKYSAKRRLGNVGESIACTFLERKGFKILARNYLRPWGEIDIVAEKGARIHIVEVKAISRENTQLYGSNRPILPEEHVTKQKLEKLARTAALYMESTADAREYQIDVVAVTLDHSNRRASCHLYEQVLGD